MAKRVTWLAAVFALVSLSRTCCTSAEIPIENLEWAQTAILNFQDNLQRLRIPYCVDVDVKEDYVQLIQGPREYHTRQGFLIAEVPASKKFRVSTRGEASLLKPGVGFELLHLGNHRIFSLNGDVPQQVGDGASYQARLQVAFCFHPMAISTAYLNEINERSILFPRRPLWMQDIFVVSVERGAKSTVVTFDSKSPHGLIQEIEFTAEGMPSQFCVYVRRKGKEDKSQLCQLARTTWHTHSLGGSDVSLPEKWDYTWWQNGVNSPVFIRDYQATFKWGFDVSRAEDLCTEKDFEKSVLGYRKTFDEVSRFRETFRAMGLKLDEVLK